MRNSIRAGVGIAALFAAGVLVVAVFGNHDSWFVRAAQANAVRCLTQSPCPRLAPAGILMGPPPLTAASQCAKAPSWQPLPGVPAGRIILGCRDGAHAFAYHMGSLAADGGGSEQWAACDRPDCEAEVRALAKLAK